MTARTAEALLTEGCDVPWEYTRLTLIRDVYRCGPEEFGRLDPVRVLDDLEVLAGEAMVRRLWAKKRR